MMAGAGVVPLSITVRFYMGCLWRRSAALMGGRRASQGASGIITRTGKRGACSTWLSDASSGGKSCQKGVIARMKGIVCLDGCYVWFPGITCAYGWAVLPARHTPHAQRLMWVIAARVGWSRWSRAWLDAAWFLHAGAPVEHSPIRSVRWGWPSSLQTTWRDGHESA